MIEKKLFFLWIGKDIPNYVFFSINSFKKLNLDFNIELVHIPDLESTDNIDVIETKNKLKDKNCLLYRIYNSRWKISNLSHNKKCRDIWFSDVLRIHLINKYGGIYLDCDTFAIKSFDEKLLNMNCFRAMSIDIKTKSKWKDNFFMGSQKGKLSWDNMKYIRTTAFGNNSIFKNSIPEEYIQNRNNFINCIDKFDVNYCMKNEYILHFKTLEWK